VSASVHLHKTRVSPGFSSGGCTVPAAVVCDECETWTPIMLPPGHPESLTRELAAGEEELLAGYADELWPEVADRQFQTLTDLMRDRLSEDPPT
jgi:hypothetical protein